MSEPTITAFMPESNHDETARQAFVVSFKQHISRTITPGNKVEMEKLVLPAFKREHGRFPETQRELRRAMERAPYHQMWGSLMRTAQELMWDSIEDTVDRQLDDLIETAKDLKEPLGSLRLDPDFQVPRYLNGVDIHCMPGGYDTEVMDDDVRAGAIYDRGAYMYALGARGMDDNGRTISAFVLTEYPDLKPKRILDVGCSVGHSTTAYADIFPDAEVHAIDVGAAMLRYAHARAETMGRKIHFAQANAEETDYEDGSFDLVVSNTMMHETSRAALPRILAECRRLLRPGGVMAHMEVPVRYKDLPLYDQVMRGWQTLYNAEPFWDAVNTMDVAALTEKAGLREVREGYIRRAADPINQPNPLLQTPNQDNEHRYILTAVK